MKKLNPEKWNRSYAAHLLVRAGFGATPEQIETAAGNPLSVVVDELFNAPEAIEAPAWIKPGIEQKPDLRAMRDLPEEERREKRKAMRVEQREYHHDLVNWWIRRMISSPCPLQEKMALFWHGHFATSMRKVRAVYMMYQQNQLFRRMGMGNYRDLITAVAQDPAMLVYLDNTRSRAGAPNENFARELMELFTLGEGYYTEQDIKEAARAFTGWMVAPRTYEFHDATKSSRRDLHDSGKKTFFGKTGTFDGHDIISIILQQDQAARYIVEKLWRFFAYDHPEPELIESLAQTFRSSGYEITPLLKEIFTSEAFYSRKAVRTQIKSPTQWLAGSCILLGLEHPNAKVCFYALRTLGQELFAPPNVKGWDGGYSWITTASLTQRYNLVASLMSAPKKPDPANTGEMSTVKTDAILPAKYRSSDRDARTYLEYRVYQAILAGEDRDALTDYLDGLPPVNNWREWLIRNVFRTMMSTPQFQLT